MTTQMMHELSHYQYLRDQLATQYPSADEETLADTLEGITDLHEMIVTVVHARLDDLSLISALKSRITNMQDRLSRIDTRAEASKRETLLKSWKSPRYLEKTLGLAPQSISRASR